MKVVTLDHGEEEPFSGHWPTGEWFARVGDHTEVLDVGRSAPTYCAECTDGEVHQQPGY